MRKLLGRSARPDGNHPILTGFDFRIHAASFRFGADVTRFSSSITFVCDTIETTIPPYFARYL